MVRDILGDIDDIHFSELTSNDVVRHRLVSAIVDAYDRGTLAQRRRDARAAKEAQTGGARAEASPAAYGTVCRAGPPVEEDRA